MTRAERREVDARIAALEQQVADLTTLLLWHAESRQRWIDTVDRGDGYIYAQTGGRLHGPRETMPVPEIGCIDRPDLKMAPVEYWRSEAVQDLDDYARDVNSW